METTVEQLSARIDKLYGEIEVAKAQLASTKTEIVKASQAREAENSAFQSLVVYRRATKEILTKALRRLEAFNPETTGGQFLQTTEQTPPVQFNKLRRIAALRPSLG